MKSNYAKQINEILSDLSASDAGNRDYGLSAHSTDDPAIVLIRDCGTAFLFHARSVIESLEGVKDVDWTYDCAEQSMQPVWDAIAGCQV